MKLALLKILVWNEVRLRMRRLSTVVCTLAVIALSWAMIPDPASGYTLIAVDDARVLYNSSALALGSASLAAILFGLGGFYLVRGRIAEDLRSGAGGVIAASEVSDGLFLCSRWLGGVAYLGLLLLAFMATILLCHALRGDAAIEALVYLQNYAILLLPMVFFAVSCAVCFDSWAPLMGKRGDILFFLLWALQLSLLAKLEQLRPDEISPWLLLDFSGVLSGFLSLRQHLQTDQIALGFTDFDASRSAVLLPSALWPARLIWLRAACALLALLPLLPARFLFHRYSPDRVKSGRTRQRRSPLAFLNAGLRPLARLAQPWFSLALRWPGFGGQVAAEVALTLAGAPAMGGALLLVVFASLLAPAAALPAVLVAAVACWGLFVGELSTRDFAACSEDLSGSAAGGVTRRYLRQLATGMLLGLLFMGVIAGRWSYSEPQRAAALLSGLLSLSALATLLGCCSRTARTFLALFLFGLYVALNATRFAMLDVVGFNGVANPASIAAQLTIAFVATLAGYTYNRRRAHRG